MITVLKTAVDSVQVPLSTVLLMSYLWEGKCGQHANLKEQSFRFQGCGMQQSRVICVMLS